MVFSLKLTSVEEGKKLGQKYTCDGDDISPEITWEAPPLNTKSFALVMDDPDAPVGTFVHWVIYNLKPDARKLPENVEKSRNTGQGWTQGKNDFGKFGYNGPCPPGKKEHKYFFKLYALGADPNLPPDLNKKGLEKMIADRTLEQAVFMARYGRS